MHYCITARMTYVDKKKVSDNFTIIHIILYNFTLLFHIQVYKYAGHFRRIDSTCQGGEKICARYWGSYSVKFRYQIHTRIIISNFIPKNISHAFNISQDFFLSTNLSFYTRRYQNTRYEGYLHLYLNIILPKHNFSYKNSVYR